MLKRLIAPTGRWFVLLATIPKAPLRLPWAMRDLPLRGVLSLKKISKRNQFLGIHLGFVLFSRNALKTQKNVEFL